MAKQLLINGLRRALAGYVEEGAQLEAQVANGRLELRDISLRRDLLEGLGEALGCRVVPSGAGIARLSVRWSWTGLLTSPLEVALEDLQISVIVSPSVPSQSAGIRRDSTPVSRPTSGLARRLWDQLRLNVRGLQLKCEVFSRELDEPSPGTVGVLLERLEVTAAKTEDGLAQNVQLEGLGVFLLPPAEHEAKDHFLLRPLTSSSRAVRSSGRRFVDHRGLELKLELGSPELRLNQEQVKCLPQLRRCLSEIISGPLSSGSSAEPTQTEAGPWAGPGGTSGAGQQANPEGTSLVQRKKSWLPSLPVSWWTSARSSSWVPEGLSESDRAIIVSEEAPAGDTAEFRLVVSWAEASLLTPDEQLSMRGSGSMTCVVPASGAWSLECGLRGSLWDRLASRPVCACRQAAAGHDLLLRVQSRSLKLVVNPMDVVPTRAAVAAARFLVEVASAVPREAAEEVAEALDAAEAAVSVSIESPRLLLWAEQTETEEQLVVETSCCTLEHLAGQSLWSLKEVRVAMPCFPGVSNEPMSLSMRSSREGLHWEIPCANISLSLVDLVPAYLASAKLFCELLSESGDLPAVGGTTEDQQPASLGEAAWRLSASVGSFRLSLLSATTPASTTVIFEGGLGGSRGVPHGETRLDLGLKLLMKSGASTPRELARTSRWCVRSGATGTVLKLEDEDSLNLTCQSSDLLVLRSFGRDCGASLGPLAEGASAGSRTGALELVVPQGTISVSFGACTAQLQGLGHYRLDAGVWSASCRFKKVFIQDSGDVGGVPVLTERAPGDVLCLLATPASLEVSLQPVALCPTPTVLQAVSSFCEEFQSGSDPGGTEQCQGHKSSLRVSAVHPRILLRGDPCRLVAVQAGSVSLEWKEGRWALEAGACSLGMVKADPASAQLAPVLLEPTNCSLSLQPGKEAQLKVDSTTLRFRPEDLDCLRRAGTWLAEDCLPPLRPTAAAGGEAQFPLQVEVTALRACLVNPVHDLVIAGSLSGSVNVRDGSWQSIVKLSVSLAEGEARQMVLEECSWDLRWSGNLLEVSCAAFALDCTSQQLSAILMFSLPWRQALGMGSALAITKTAGARGGEGREQGKPITLRARGHLGAKAATNGCWSAQLGLSHLSVLDEERSVCSLREQAQQCDNGISIAGASSVGQLADSRSVQVRLGPIDVCPTEAAAIAVAMLLPDVAAATRAGAAAAGEARPGGLSVCVECELPRLLLPGGPKGHDAAELLFKAARCALSLEPGGQSWSLRMESAQVELVRPCSGTQAASILEAGSVVLAECNGERSCNLASAQVHLGPTDVSSIISVGSRLKELAELAELAGPASHTGTNGGPAPSSTHRLSAKAVGLTVTLSRLPGSSAVLMLVGDVDVSRASSGDADLAFRFSASLGASSAAPRLICRSRWGLSLRENNLNVKSLECLALQCQSSDIALLQSFHEHFLPEQRPPSASASEGSMNLSLSLETVVPEAKVVLELSEAVRIEAEGKAHLSVSSASGTSGTRSWTFVAGLSKVFLRDRAEQRPVLSRRLGSGVQADSGDVVAVRANGQTMEVVMQAIDLAPTAAALQAVHQWLERQAGLLGRSTQESQGCWHGQPALDVVMKSPRVLLHSGGHVATLEAGAVRVARQAAAPMTVNVEACRLLLESPAGPPPCVVLEPTTWALSIGEKVVALQVQTVVVRALPSHLPGFRSIVARLKGDLLKAISGPGGRGTGALPLKCSLGSLKLLLGGQEVLELSGRIEGGSTAVPGGSDLQITAALSISLGQQALVQGSRWDLTWTSSRQQLHLLNAELAFRVTSRQMRDLQQSMMSWWSAWGSSPSTAAATTAAAGSGATQVKLSLQRVTGAILDEVAPHQTQTATVLLEGTSVIYNAGSICLGLGRAELGLEGVLGHLCLTSLELSGAMPRYRASLSFLELLDVDGNRAVQACNLNAVATGNSVVQDPLSPNVRDIEVSGSLDGVVVDTTDRFLRPLAEAMQHFGVRIAEVCGGNSQAMEFGAKVEVSPLKVEVRRFAFEDSKVGLQVESAIIQLQRVFLAERRTTFSILFSSIMGAYKSALQAHAPRLVASISVGGFGVGDAAYASLGSAVGQLAIGCGSLGSALGCAAARGAAAALDASKTKGKELRGGSEDYQFGDVTRGLASAAMRPGEVASAAANFIKEEKVASSTVGAVLGTTVGVVAGPVGCVAGAAAGSAVGRKLSDTVASTIERGKEARGGDRGYHFGDFTRGLVAGDSAGGHHAGPQNQQRPGKWRYDDINPIAKVNPLRFSCKPTVQDLRRDIAERAEPGRPIYVELEAVGTPYCRVLRERSAAVTWLQSLQPESPSRGSETSRSNPGDMLLRPSIDSAVGSTAAVKSPSFPATVASSGPGPKAASQRQQPDLMDLGPADLGLGQVSSGHGPMHSTRSQSLLDFDPAERISGTDRGSAGPAHPLAKSSLLD